MEINGKSYTEDDITRRLKELDIAVSQLPADAPLRPHFEFLLGVIDAHERGEYSDCEYSDGEDEAEAFEDNELKKRNYGPIEAIVI